ncbi:Ras guanine-nucleotide exchange protein [Fusarium denticulatum]|uniref:Ras guanine-nucleotide exchange protein n=1 Tax=Fusarium denticulatum TaxID=48507 RepID=A0A8H5WQR6_9HYPO|nr:Ras guanine-nucleotide exchange protein [Fusarium denticulatum]
MEPTAHGFIRNAVDALLVLEACLQGRFRHTSRAPRPEEARSVIHDGAIFVCEVGASATYEWRDHSQWHDELVLAISESRAKLTIVSQGMDTPHDLDQIQIQDGLVEVQLHLCYSVAYNPWYGWTLGFDKGELGAICHVEPSGWAECSLLKCGSVGWMPLNYCNVFDPRPMKPLLKAVIKFTQALRSAPGVPVVSHVEEGDIDAIVQGVSNIMVLGYRLDTNYPQKGAWKALCPIVMCVHNRIIVLQKHLGTMRERTPIQGKKDTINRMDLVSAALEIVIKADNFLSVIQKLHKSYACRSPTNAERPNTVENRSKTSRPTADVDASNKEPDSALVKGPGKHTYTDYLALASSHGFTEHMSSSEAQEREDSGHDFRDAGSQAELERHPVCRTDDIPPQPPGHQTFIPNRSVVGRTQMAQCSLPDLIEHLVNCEPQSIRDQFAAAFFITWELFCTSEELLNALTKRPQRLTGSSAVLLRITKSIDIFQRDHSSKSPSTPTIKEDSVCSHGSNMTMDIADILFACRGDKISVVHIYHDYLAAQITSKQMQVFCTIQSRELLAGRWMAHDSKDAPNVVAMCRLTNGISVWVKESVLTEAEPASRGRVIERWILTAQHLFHLSNFDGLVVVTSGLDDSSILRLKLSWDAVSVQAKESFRSLRRIVDPSENRRTLRALFSSSPAPRLPFLGSYLSQLVFVNEYHKHKNFKEGEVSSGSSKKVIN